MINKTIMHGRLTKDPELKQTQSGVSQLIFTVAWSKKYKETETKCFLLCKAWRHTAEFIAKYFKKGSEIMIDGHMVTETWQDDKPVTLCLVDEAHFAGSKVSANNDTTANTQPKPQPMPPADDFVNIPDDIQEELPFN